MSKKGHYPGGHTLLGPKSNWFGTAHQAKKQTKMLQEGQLAHEEHLKRAAAKAAARSEAIKQRLARQDRKKKAREAHIAGIEHKLADPAYQEQQKAAEPLTQTYQKTQQRMARVVVVRKNKRDPNKG